MYDPNGDGQIDEGELKDIIISCVAENGMEFDEQQVISWGCASYGKAVSTKMDEFFEDSQRGAFSTSSLSLMLKY